MRRRPSKELLIALTIMDDIDGSARSENGENTRIIEACSVCRAVLDLGTKMESVSTRVCQVARLDPP